MRPVEVATSQLVTVYDPYAPHVPEMVCSRGPRNIRRVARVDAVFAETTVFACPSKEVKTATVADNDEDEQAFEVTFLTTGQPEQVSNCAPDDYIRVVACRALHLTDELGQVEVLMCGEVLDGTFRENNIHEDATLKLSVVYQ